MEPVTLFSERLELRTFTPSDAEEVRAAVQDPRIRRWIPLPDPYGPAEAEDFVGRYVPQAWRDDTEYTFAARPRDRDDAPLVASTSLHHPRSGTWEIGFYTVAEHRGHGYATEATLALAHWAFTTLGCSRLEWRAEVGNTASRLVAEKAGFTVEGVLRAGLDHRGTRRDCWIAALLPSDLGLPGPVPHLPPPGP
ncbi:MULTISPECIES: GNAT family N-acetyltransferase [Streptomyces]|uniref:Acetyltransferase n=2 Tax=Streptomyces TaxID=1883 RepID=A0A100Y1D7_9ACTN|nr:MULTISPECIES: GNAT family protein [Streptomyces]KUH35906.1 acetyltransferase [Streptomyces kanasensis]UUS31353.1 GNAT family N-acetyltransferase [Streptomyces changanensis]